MRFSVQPWSPTLIFPRLSHILLSIGRCRDQLLFGLHAPTVALHRSSPNAPIRTFAKCAAIFRKEPIATGAKKYPFLRGVCAADIPLERPAHDGNLRSAQRTRTPIPAVRRAEPQSPGIKFPCQAHGSSIHTRLCGSTKPARARPRHLYQCNATPWDGR